MKPIYYLAILLLPCNIFAQSTLESAIKAGEFLMAGYSIFKIAKADPKKESKTIETVCIKNRLTDKFTYTINGESFDGEKVKKELVVQVDSKECFLELPKGIYTYEVILANKEVYKKGDYKFEEDVIITFRKD
jgi:hypothetical protein